MVSCVKPKVLAYVSEAVKQDKIKITEDLAIVKSREVPEDVPEEDYQQYDNADPARKELLRSLMLEKLDSYLSSHQLEAKLPEAISGSNIVPRAMVDSIPSSVAIPLADTEVAQGEP